MDKQLWGYTTIIFSLLFGWYFQISGGLITLFDLPYILNPFFYIIDFFERQDQLELVYLTTLVIFNGLISFFMILLGFSLVRENARITHFQEKSYQLGIVFIISYLYSIISNIVLFQISLIDNYSFSIIFILLGVVGFVLFVLLVWIFVTLKPYTMEISQVRRRGFVLTGYMFINYIINVVVIGPITLAQDPNDTFVMVTTINGISVTLLAVIYYFLIQSLNHAMISDKPTFNELP